MATTKATTLAHTIASTTSSTADLNYAKTLNDTGVTSTEFDKLDGLTATTNELNLVDGSVTGPLSHRNMIINGDMQVAQRYSSAVTSVATGYNSADRWRTFQSGTGTFTQSIESDGPPGFAKSLKMLCTNNDSSIGSADRLWVSQKFEGQNLQSLSYGTSSAKTATLSFWVKSNKTGTYIVFLYTPTGRFVSLSYTISSSATWEYKTVTIPADTSQAVTNDNAERLDVRFFLGAGSNYTSGTLNTTWNSTANSTTAVGQTNLASDNNNYWQITGVQLELGSVATPFEFKSYGEELQRCQRYYWRMPNNKYVFSIIDGNGTYVAAQFHHPVRMRATPAVGLLHKGAFYWNPSGSGQSNETPNGSTTGFSGGDEHGGLAYVSGSNNLGGLNNDQILGQWFCRWEFRAELE